MTLSLDVVVLVVSTLFYLMGKHIISPIFEKKHSTEYMYIYFTHEFQNFFLQCKQEHLSLRLLSGYSPVIS